MPDTTLEIGETCYVVSSASLAATSRDFCPVDNASLLTADGSLRPGLLEGVDYTVLKAGQWAALVAHYGGGPAVARSVIEQGGVAHLELAPLRLEVLVRGGLPRTLALRASRALPAGVLLADLAALLHLPPAGLCLLAPGPAGWLPVPPTRPLGLLALGAGRLLLAAAGPVPPPLPPLLPADAVAGPAAPGTTGLANLGSTCYMNAALQALSHTRLLRPYFLARYHLADLNRANPLGTRGTVAAEFGALLGDLWSGSFQAVAPRAFRRAVTEQAPQLGGARQHDAQELLAFLLDALHEDLAHGGRSAVASTFRGQLRSTLRCLACARLSVTVDSFTQLSLPFPATAAFPVLHPHGLLDLHLPPDAKVSALAAAAEAAAAGGPVHLAEIGPAGVAWLPASRRLSRLAAPLLAYSVPPPGHVPVAVLGARPRVVHVPAGAPLAAVAAAAGLPPDALAGPAVVAGREQVRVLSDGPSQLPPPPATTTVADCLARFLQAETLGAGDEWHCPACASTQPAVKQLALLTPPPALVLHLKRFRHLDGHSEKIGAECAYPPLLPLAGASYRLYAVVCHHGQLSGGHYTAYCAVPRPSPNMNAAGAEEEEWYLFNDAHVRPARPGEHLQPAHAYILFYRRL